ncbi:non-homologous end-joining DNA ligase [Amycolatopsis sp. PS_44_ISF1]|uniref:non-homologous end-joining DNA ligase n=1 Tax=Amycolatopsis sp. PS_44_ISF1 TaxID=2974917 RepID=UPI0028DE52F3|nr:non-homologous end-joining DNA ligase [Amycolatopsis sp. PS_44_ISF1]MDT8915255.1 non-homologous end-joining DNA ligase [Amycolatopsis sp. PS_44_ISF1]
MPGKGPAGRSRVPEPVEPMLATPDRGRLAEGPHYAYEWKWDGYRAVMRVAPDGTTVLTSRNRTDFTTRYPELAGAFGDALGGRAAVLDGEIVALDEHGRPDFGLLQNHGTSGRTVAYFAFDVLLLGADRLLGEPYDERRKVLEGLEPPDRRLVAITPSYAHTDLAAQGSGPQDLLEVAAERGLEGLVAKDRRSKYHPGRRSPDWLKHPLVRTLEVVVGGWRPGQGNREGTIGALLLGAHSRESGELLYLGDVGTGFTRATLADLLATLTPLERRTSPFANVVPRERARGARWVTPKLVGEVVYRQFTPGEHRLRHTAWRGWRPDRRAEEAVVPLVP